MDRTKTCIKGFDNLIEGGFPKGSTILLSGTPGTGKTKPRPTPRSPGRSAPPPPAAGPAAVGRWPGRRYRALP